jgi:glycosyltransferase involved in cell wall biosynthesis
MAEEGAVVSGACMKKVLMVVFHYPPWSGGSAVHRTLKFTKYLPEFGWQPIVLTPSLWAYPQNGAAPCEVPEGVEVARAFALDTANHLAFRGSYLKCLALPDRWISWWPGAVLTGLRLLRHHKPDAIWSTYPIATTHLIALTLKRLSRLPWVADFRDPMKEVDPNTGEEFPEDPAIRKVNGWIEKPTLKHCSRAVFTTPGTLKMYTSRFADVPPTRWAVIPNGYDEEDFVLAERSARRLRPQTGGPALLLHSGVLYPYVRDPSCFFAALADLRHAGRVTPSTLKVVLRASGFDELYRPRLRSLGIDDIVFLEPPVSHQESVIEMLNADGLLIFQAANCNWQIPAKLYECLRARRPIFAITDRAGDTADVLRSEGIDSIFPLNSKTEIADGLVKFMSAVGNGKDRRRSVEHYSRKARTQELAHLLDAVCKTVGPGIRRSSITTVSRHAAG